MKKTVLSLALVLASTNVMAETYFKVGLTQTTATLDDAEARSTFKNFPDSEATSDEASGTVSSSEGYPTMVESLGVTDIESLDITFALGHDFNEYVSGEIRYTLGASNSIKELGQINRDNVDEYAEAAGIHFDGTVFTTDMTIEMQNRMEGLILLKTPKFYGLQPYVMGGYSASSISVGRADLDVNGVTYGAGLEFDFDNNWSLSLEYQVFPEISDKISFKEEIESYDSNNSSSGTTSGTGQENSKAEAINEVNYKYTYDANRAALTLSYRF